MSVLRGEHLLKLTLDLDLLRIFLFPFGTRDDEADLLKLAPESVFDNGLQVVLNWDRSDIPFNEQLTDLILGLAGLIHFRVHENLCFCDCTFFYLTNKIR